MQCKNSSRIFPSDSVGSARQRSHFPSKHDLSNYGLILASTSNAKSTGVTLLTYMAWLPH